MSVRGLPEAGAPGGAETPGLAAVDGGTIGSFIILVEYIEVLLDCSHTIHRIEARLP
jgi:hypothetical protein